MFNATLIIDANFSTKLMEETVNDHGIKYLSLTTVVFFVAFLHDNHLFFLGPVTHARLQRSEDDVRRRDDVDAYDAEE